MGTVVCILRLCTLQPPQANSMLHDVRGLFHLLLLLALLGLVLHTIGRHADLLQPARASVIPEALHHDAELALSRGLLHRHGSGQRLLEASRKRLHVDTIGLGAKDPLETSCEHGSVPRPAHAAMPPDRHVHREPQRDSKRQQSCQGRQRGGVGAYNRRANQLLQCRAHGLQTIDERHAVPSAVARANLHHRRLSLPHSPSDAPGSAALRDCHAVADRQAAQKLIRDPLQRESGLVPAAVRKQPDQQRIRLDPLAVLLLPELLAVGVALQGRDALGPGPTTVLRLGGLRVLGPQGLDERLQLRNSPDRLHLDARDRSTTCSRAGGASTASLAARFRGLGCDTLRPWLPISHVRVISEDLCNHGFRRVFLEGDPALPLAVREKHDQFFEGARLNVQIRTSPPARTHVLRV
mmetsp:Transcript_5501/g.13524  ORF Transcript_5501/g.13524 Transcript_5501/m.13524 type:complete len:409 (+) Transcript_5501:1-1227(+)